MLQEDKYFFELSEPELWQRYCGFLDLSVDEFMAIQEHLLLDEIQLIGNTELGKKMLHGTRPQSVADFARWSR